MADQTPPSNEDQILDVRAQERARFIRQQRFRPTFWITTAGAYIRYALVLSVFCFLIVAPAVFYWGSQLASHFELTSLSELLSHVGVEHQASSADGGSSESLSDQEESPVDPVGFAVWTIVGFLASVLGWFVSPIQSPLQRAADKHMMAWSGGAAESIHPSTPVSPPPPTANSPLVAASADPLPTQPEVITQKAESSHA